MIRARFIGVDRFLDERIPELAKHPPPLTTADTQGTRSRLDALQVRAFGSQTSLSFHDKSRDLEA